MRLLRSFLALAGLLVVWAAPLHAAELVVSAAASLTNAFQEIKPAFEVAHPGVTVTFNFGASGALLRQMAEGAPVDVFAAADQETMDKAAGLLLPGSRVNFAANTLVMIVPADSKLGLAGPKDLFRPDVERVAMGNPASVPAGRYARDALTLTVYEKLLPRVVPAESVRQVLDYVARGEAQAGFVYATDARVAAGKVKVVAEMAGHQPITYPVAVVAASRNAVAARSFVDFVAGPAGLAVLQKHGFRKP